MSNPHWPNTTVGKEFDVQLGKMLDAARNTGDLKPYLGNRAVQWGRIELEAASEVPLTKADQARYRLRDGDLLVCEGGEVGRAAIWNSELPECYYQKALHRLRPRRNYHPRLLQAVFEHLAATNGFANFVTQTSIAHLPRERLLSVPIPRIPRPEQERIVSVLDDWEGLRGAIGRLIVKKEQIKCGLMQELLDRRSRLPGFHGAWVQTTAGSVGFFRGGSGFPLAFQGQTSGKYPFFKVSDMNRAGNDVFMKTAQHYISQPARRRLGAVAFPMNAIVFAKVGAAIFLERKRILAGPSCIDNNMAGFVPAPGVDVRYMHYALSAVRFGALVATTALPSLNGRQLAAIPLYLPTDVKEQQAIAAVLSDAGEEIVVLRRRLAKTRDITQTLMQQLLTGRMRLPMGAPEELVA